MNLLTDPAFRLFLGILFGLLILASAIGFALSRRSWSDSTRPVIENLNGHLDSDVNDRVVVNLVSQLIKEEICSFG